MSQRPGTSSPGVPAISRRPRGRDLLVPVQLRRRHHHHGLQRQHLQNMARHLHVRREWQEVEHEDSAVDGRQQDQGADHKIEAQAGGVGRGLLIN